MVTDQLRLPSFRGNVLRSALHVALRRSVCPFPPSKPCAGCELRSSCPYPRVVGVGDSASMDHSPLFLTYFDPSTPDVLDVGQRVSIHMRLFGPAVSSPTYLVYAVENLSRFGLGAPGAGGRRGRFVLEHVLAKDGVGGRHLIFDRSGRPTKPVPSLTLGDFLNAGNEKFYGPGAVQLTFQTPLRLKHRGRLIDQLPFSILLRAIFRRLSTVYAFSTNQKLPVDFGVLLEKAEIVRIKDQDLRWFDYVRYSKTHAMRLRIGGLLGNITYEGPVDDYRDFLLAGAFLGIGRSISFGFGRYTIKRIEGDSPACVQTN